MAKMVVERPLLYDFGGPTPIFPLPSLTPVQARDAVLFLQCLGLYTTFLYCYVVHVAKIPLQNFYDYKYIFILITKD